MKIRIVSFFVLSVSCLFFIAAGCSHEGNPQPAIDVERSGEPPVLQPTPPPGAPRSVSVSSIKLIGPGDVEFALDARPLPTCIKRIDIALSSYVRPQSFPSKVKLVQGDDAIDASVSVSLNNTSVSLIPARCLAAKSSYKVSIDPDIESAFGGFTSDEFTTMTPGDMTGDGKPDFAISAPGREDGTLHNIFVFSGATVAERMEPSEALTTIRIERDEEGSEVEIALVGDVNGDGHEDFSIAASDFNERRGRVDFFSGKVIAEGGNPSRNEAFASVIGDASPLNIGLAIAGIGDLNGDGFADVAVTSDATMGSRCMVHIFSGATLSSRRELSRSNAHVCIADERGSGNFGRAIAAVGDINRDGVFEVAIGDETYIDNATSQPGAVFVYNGVLLLQSPPQISLVARIIGQNDQDKFGASVAGIGDIDNGGHSDIIIGAYDFTNEAIARPEERGAAYVFFGEAINAGGTRRVSDAQVTILGEGRLDRLGRTVIGLGDVTGDGIPDAVAGSHEYSRGERMQYGGLVLISGADILSRTSVSRQIGSGTELLESYGISAATIGDITDDGIPEILVGILARNAEIDIDPGRDPPVIVTSIPGAAEILDGASLATDTPVIMSVIEAPLGSDGQLGHRVSAGGISF